MLGQPMSASPSNITINNETVTNPNKITEEYAELHQNKIRGLRAHAPTQPSLPTASRVSAWLSKRPTPPPTFSFKPITKRKLHQLVL